jgi:site-specific DNA-methyltransferase (adenine-specific)
LLVGNCLEKLKALDDNSIDSIVTDPPYELSFMGKAWDGSGIAYSVELWTECLRVLKPGGHLLAFGATRTYHRMAVAIEDAGFEIRDSIHWIYGSGFPKSLDVSKAIDKTAGAEREVVGSSANGIAGGTGEHAGEANAYGFKGTYAITDPATDAAKTWQGWGTALKPAHEPIVVARKPLAGTVAANVLAHGTGAINIDGCRVGNEVRTNNPNGATAGGARIQQLKPGAGGGEAIGRWPANIVLTHAAECVQTGTRSDTFSVVSSLRDYPQHSNFGARAQVHQKPQPVEVPVWSCVGGCPVAELDAQSGASRFFTVTEWDPTADAAPFLYVAKPGKKERNAGLDGLPKKQGGGMRGTADKSLKTGSGNERDGITQNFHPTVKPVALMRYLVRLVTPPGGIVLDPFLGSGTTAVAAILEGFDWRGCEMTKDYLPIIRARTAWATKERKAELAAGKRKAKAKQAKATS